MPIPDLQLVGKDMTRSCVFDFPDRPVRPEPPIDPVGGPPDEYPYNPVWDWPPLDPPPTVDPDDPHKGDPPDPSAVPATHWLHVFEVTMSDTGVYTAHGTPPHEIWMYRQIGEAEGYRIGKVVCIRNVQEISPHELSGATIKFWDKPRKTDFETYTPITPDGISSLDPNGPHVMVYWFVFHWTNNGELVNWAMASAGGYFPDIPPGNDSMTHPGMKIWFPLVPTGQVKTESHTTVVKNTKHTDVGVNVSIS